MNLKRILLNNSTFIIILLVSTIAYFFGVYIIQEDVASREEEIVTLEASIGESHYNIVLREVLSNIDIIETYVDSIGMENITDESFDNFMEGFNPKGVDFVSLSIAPDGILEFYYSEEYGEGLIGRDLVNDDRDFVREAVALAIEENVIVVNGPFDLIQGNQGIVFRKPVFDNEEFVGLINFVVDYDVLQETFDELDLISIHVGIYDHENLIFGQQPLVDDMYKFEQIDLDYVDWHIGIQVNDGYAQSRETLNILFGIGFLVVYGIIAYLWIRYYSKTRSLIGQQNILIKYDNLTKLPNRRMFVEETQKLIESGTEFYLGFGDLDNFKNINDVLGHSIGDRYLSFISEKMKLQLNENLRIYRWGGDEFIFVFIENDRSKIINEIDQIFDVFKTPFDINGSKHQISISIGLVHHPIDGTVLDELVSRADIVMYDIKAHYKNTYSFFEEKYLKELYDQVEFQQKLEQFEISDFEVFFQPIVDVNTNQVVGFEGLSRLFDQDGKQMNTQAIIKRYEQDGTITSLDKHVFHKVCENLNKVSETCEKEYFMTFNISPLSLSMDFIDYLRRTSNSYNIDTSKIIIEVIETLGFKDVKISVELLSEIKKLGFRVAMDDFGMGYSSLSYIAQLPLDIIKIDKSFIHTYEENKFNLTILKTIQDISESLELETLVEGIETKKQLDFVKSLGVEFYQGYYHSKPQRFDDLIKKLK